VTLIATVSPVLASRDGIIDKRNRFVLQPDYWYVRYCGNGIYQCRKERDSKPFLVDHNGILMSPKIPPDCELVETLFKRREGRLSHSVPPDTIFIVTRNRKYGVLSAQGKVVIPFDFDWMRVADKETLVLTKTVPGRAYDEFYFDRINRRLSSEPFPSIGFYYTPSERMIPFNDSAVHPGRHTRWGVYDMDHNLVIPKHFKDISRFHDGLAIAETDTANCRRYYIDTKGNFVAPKIEPVTLFYDGIAIAKESVSSDAMGLINRKFQFVTESKYFNLQRITKRLYAGRLSEKSPFVAITRSGKRLFDFPPNVVGFNYLEGNLIVCQYDSGVPPPEGQLLNTCAYDKTGKQIVPPDYFVGGIDNGFLVVIEPTILTDRLSGVMNYRGKFIMPMECAYFVATERNRLIKTVRSLHFDRDEWSHTGQRLNEFAHFLKDYDLIGMSVNQVHELLGRERKFDGYELSMSTSLEIEYDEEKVRRWRISNSDHSKDAHWITENMIFDPAFEPRDKLVPKPTK
jgi:hypothetical protein